MKNLSIVICLLFSFVISCNKKHVDPLDKEYQVKKFDSPCYFINGSKSIIKTSDGNYLILGNKFRKTTYLVKINPSGNTIWKKTIDSCETEEIQTTPDGGYILTGSKIVGEFHNSTNAFLIKLDPLGNIEWKKDYGRGYEGRGIRIIQKNDGFMLFTAYGKAPNGEDSLGLLKTQHQGDSLSIQHLLTQYNFLVYEFILDSDSKAVFSMGSRIIKKDTLGGDIFDVNLNTIPFPVCNTCHVEVTIRSIVQTTDKGYLCSGDIGRSVSYRDFLLVKLDQNGNILWYKTQDINLVDTGTDVELLSDGNIVTVGHSQQSGNMNTECISTKYTSNGEFVWTSKYGLGESGGSSSIINKSNDEFLITGVNNNGELLIINFNKK